MRNKTLSIAIVVLTGASMIVPSHAVAAAPTCFGKRATIVGTNRNKRERVELKGTPGNDVIVGLGGYDYIDARGGNDLICAGGGDDEVKGGPGNDEIRGEGDIDTASGGGGQ